MNEDLDNFDGPVPIFPLPNAVLFPRIVLPFHIFEPRYVKMVNDTLTERHLIGLVLLRPGWETPGSGNPAIHSVGCVGRISDLMKLPDGRFNLSLFGLRRFRIEEEYESTPYRTARVSWLPESNEEASGSEVDAGIAEIVKLLNSVPELLESDVLNSNAFPSGENFGRSIHALALRARLFPTDLQALLEIDDTIARALEISKMLESRVRARRLANHSRKFAPEDPGVN